MVRQQLTQSNAMIKKECLGLANNSISEYQILYG